MFLLFLAILQHDIQLLFNPTTSSFFFDINFAWLTSSQIVVATAGIL